MGDIPIMYKPNRIINKGNKTIIKDIKSDWFKKPYCLAKKYIVIAKVAILDNFTDLVCISQQTYRNRLQILI